MSSAALIEGRATHSTRRLSGSLSRLLRPSLSDCLFMMIFAWLFLSGKHGWSGLLADGDAGWHIRTGDFILSTGSVPRADLFSFSKAGQPWFAWEWGADVIYSLLHSAWGLKGHVLFSGILIAFFAAFLLRYTLMRGATGFVALFLTLLVIGASSIHFLARPHLFTLVLVPVVIWAIERDRDRPGRGIWWLVPLTAVWANLHGGFLALIALLGLLSLGSAIETAWTGAPGWKQSIRYTLLTAACAAASLFNPYGWQLHRHIFHYLNSGFIRDVVEEFQSPSFRNENILQYEIVLLAGLLTAALLLSKRRVTEPLWILFWAHQSLASVRHVPIYVALAAPLVAVEISLLWRQWIEPAGRKSFRKILDTISADFASAARWTSPWPAVFLVAVFWWPGIAWPTDFPDVKFPVAMAAKYGTRLESARLLTTDQWADYLIYRNYPRQKVFIDGRSDFYGPELGRKYIKMMTGHWSWRRTLDEYEFDLALLPHDVALTSLLKTAHGWRVLEDGGQVVMFERVAGRQKTSAPPAAVAAPKKYPSGLMKSFQASELLVGELIPMKAGRNTITRSRNKSLRPSPSVLERWNLLSGKDLGDLALGAGFLAPTLMPRSSLAGSRSAGMITSRQVADMYGNASLLLQSRTAGPYEFGRPGGSADKEVR